MIELRNVSDAAVTLYRFDKGLPWKFTKGVDYTFAAWPDSPTLGQWFGLELSAENKKMLLVPEGFAHGYAVLSDESEMMTGSIIDFDQNVDGTFD